LFKEQLEEALKDVSVASHSLAVLFLDLDGFKASMTLWGIQSAICF